MVTELKIVGGDPALDLINTVGDDRVPDPLDGYGAFVAWAVRAGVIEEAAADGLAARGHERAQRAEGALTEARDLRAAMDAVFRPLASGGTPPRHALSHLVQRAGAAVERARLARANGGFLLAWDGDHLERPLWPLAAAALDLVRSGPIDRLKACEGCPWLFLDTSRNHSRRWCSMDDCGSRSKLRSYRARRATAGR